MLVIYLIVFYMEDTKKQKEKALAEVSEISENSEVLSVESEDVPLADDQEDSMKERKEETDDGSQD